MKKGNDLQVSVVLRDVEQVIWVEGWNTCLVCWANGAISSVKGEEGKAVFARCARDVGFVPGVNGRRLVRRGRLDLVRPSV